MRKFGQVAVITAAWSAAVLMDAGIASADGHEIGDTSVMWNCGTAGGGFAPNAKACWSAGDAEGAEDIGQQRGQDLEPADNEGTMGSSVFTIDYSTDTPHNNMPTQHNNPTASYPAKPSWPGAGWGVAD